MIVYSKRVRFRIGDRIIKFPGIVLRTIIHVHIHVHRYHSVKRTGRRFQVQKRGTFHFYASSSSLTGWLKLRWTNKLNPFQSWEGTTIPTAKIRATFAWMVGSLSSPKHPSLFVCFNWRSAARFPFWGNFLFYTRFNFFSFTHTALICIFFYLFWRIMSSMEIYGAPFKVVSRMDFYPSPFNPFIVSIVF